MTDCSNAEIRDLLPDYLHEQLVAADALTVEQHVSSCVDCASELALLRSAFDVRPHAIAIDVARIVASLPKPGAISGAPTAVVGAPDPAVRALSSAPSVVRRASALRGVRVWRAAAAILVIAVGGMSVAIARHGTNGVIPAGSTSDSAGVEVALAQSATGVNVADSGTSATAQDPRDVSLSVGELSDYSDAEIESVIERLDKWDGAAAADPLPGVPLLPVSQGTEQ